MCALGSLLVAINILHIHRRVGDIEQQAFLVLFARAVFYAHTHMKLAMTHALSRICTLEQHQRLQRVIICIYARSLSLPGGRVDAVPIYIYWRTASTRAWQRCCHAPATTPTPHSPVSVGKGVDASSVHLAVEPLALVGIAVGALLERELPVSHRRCDPSRGMYADLSPPSSALRIDPISSTPSLLGMHIKLVTIHLVCEWSYRASKLQKVEQIQQAAARKHLQSHSGFSLQAKVVISHATFWINTTQGNTPRPQLSGARPGSTV